MLIDMDIHAMLEAVFQSVVAYDRMAAMIKPYIGYSGSTQNQSEVVQGRFRRSACQAHPVV